MTFPDAIGSLGVGMLLGAFLLNLTGWLRAETRAYRALNALGAGLACYAAWMIDFIPFVVLEGAWSAVAIFALVRGERGEPA